MYTSGAVDRCSQQRQLGLVVGTGILCCVTVERIYPWPCGFSLHIGFILCALSPSRVLLGSRISIFYGFSDLPINRVPALLCDHGLLRLRVDPFRAAVPIWGQIT